MKLYNNKQIGKYLTLETKDVDKSQNNLIDCLYFADNMKSLLASDAHDIRRKAHYINRVNTLKDKLGDTNTIDDLDSISKLINRNITMYDPVHGNHKRSTHKKSRKSISLLKMGKKIYKPITTGGFDPLGRKQQANQSESFLLNKPPSPGVTKSVKPLRQLRSDFNNFRKDASFSNFRFNIFNQLQNDLFTLQNLITDPDESKTRNFIGNFFNNDLYEVFQEHLPIEPHQVHLHCNVTDIKGGNPAAMGQTIDLAQRALQMIAVIQPYLGTVLEKSPEIGKYIQRKLNNVGGHLQAADAKLVDVTYQMKIPGVNSLRGIFENNIDTKLVKIFAIVVEKNMTRDLITEDQLQNVRERNTSFATIKKIRRNWKLAGFLTTTANANDSDIINKKNWTFSDRTLYSILKGLSKEKKDSVFLNHISTLSRAYFTDQELSKIKNNLDDKAALNKIKFDLLNKGKTQLASQLKRLIDNTSMTPLDYFNSQFTEHNVILSTVEKDSMDVCRQIAFEAYRWMFHIVLVLMTVGSISAFSLINSKSMQFDYITEGKLNEQADLYSKLINDGNSLAEQCFVGSMVDNLDIMKHESILRPQYDKLYEAYEKNSNDVEKISNACKKKDFDDLFNILTSKDKRFLDVDKVNLMYENKQSYSYYDLQNMKKIKEVVASLDDLFNTANQSGMNPYFNKITKILSNTFTDVGSVGYHIFHRAAYNTVVNKYHRHLEKSYFQNVLSMAYVLFTEGRLPNINMNDLNSIIRLDSIPYQNEMYTECLAEAVSLKNEYDIRKSWSSKYTWDWAFANEKYNEDYDDLRIDIMSLYVKAQLTLKPEKFESLQSQLEIEYKISRAFFADIALERLVGPEYIQFKRTVRSAAELLDAIKRLSNSDGSKIDTNIPLLALPSPDSPQM